MDQDKVLDALDELLEGVGETLATGRKMIARLREQRLLDVKDVGALTESIGKQLAAVKKLFPDEE